MEMEIASVFTTNNILESDEQNVRKNLTKKCTYKSAFTNVNVDFREIFSLILLLLLITNLLTGKICNYLIFTCFSEFYYHFILRVVQTFKV